VYDGRTVTSERAGPDRPTEDVELTERACDGDVGAFEELVTRNQRLAFRAAWLVLGNRGDAEDVVQESFVKAYYALPRFRRGSPFRPWLMRIVVNEARNRARSSRRRDGLTLRVAAMAPSEAIGSAEAEVLAHEDAEILLAAMDRLPERDRLVVACRYLFEMSESETAEVLGVRRGTVKSRLSRALGRLRSDLADVPADRELGRDGR
jgi:RNA polymerase sigma factor (sigma-70 family)